MDHLDADLVGDLDLHQGIFQRLDGTGGIALDDDVEHVDLGLGELLLEALERNDLTALGQLSGTLGSLTLLGDLTCGAVVAGDQEQVSCGRHGGQTKHLHRSGRSGFLHGGAVLVKHGAHAAIGGSRHDGVADMQRTGLYQHGSHGTATLVESGFHGGATSIHIRVGAQVEFGIRGEQHGFEQLVDIGALLGGDVNEHGVAAILLRHQTVFGELAAHLVGVGALLIDLVHGDHDRHVCGLSVVDGLHGLRHYAIIGRDHENRDIGQFGAAGTHCGEGFVARGIEERDLAGFTLKINGDLVCTDTLRDAAGFACDDVGAADGVEQSGLTMIDVAHDGDDRRARPQILILLQFLFIQIDVELLQQLLILLFGGHDLDVPADFLAEDLEGGLIQGLRCRGHFAEMEQHGDKGRRIDVDLLGQIGQGRALTQTDGLSVTGRNANAADDRGLHLLEFLTLRQTVLTCLRGFAALTPECACGASATAAAAACRAAARSAVALIAAGIATTTEAVAATCRTLAAALTRTMLAPLPRLGTGALSRTTAEATALAAALTGATATTTFVAIGIRTRHRVRTRNVTRRRRMHALLAAERIVARTRSRSMRLGVVATALLLIVAARCVRTRHRSGLAATHACGRLRTRRIAALLAIAMLTLIARTTGMRGTLARLRRGGAAWLRGFRPRSLPGRRNGLRRGRPGLGWRRMGRRRRLLDRCCGFLGFGRIARRIVRERAPQLAGDWRLHGRRSGLHEFAHRLKFA